MIRIHKDLDVVPSSLMDRKTEKRRDNCIKDSKYHQKKEFNQRFKQDDIKEILKKIYNQKCAFCERKIEECRNNKLADCSSTVEHYRPKSKYYWLAYSWDNLLWCCHRCNQHKDNKFEVLNTKVAYSEIFLNNIHKSSIDYQISEEPLMIHPEFESVLNELEFNNGIMTSEDRRVKYTIETCKLDRYDLNEKRRTVIDDFMEDIVDKKLKGISIETSLKALMNDITERREEFIALRYWILKNHKFLVEDN